MAWEEQAGTPYSSVSALPSQENIGNNMEKKNNVGHMWGYRLENALIDFSYFPYPWADEKGVVTKLPAQPFPDEQGIVDFGTSPLTPWSLGGISYNCSCCPRMHYN